MKNLMGKYGHIILFTLIGVSGALAALKAIDLQAILFPLVCHVAADTQAVANECTGKIIAFTGKWVAILAGVGAFIERTIVIVNKILSVADETAGKS